VDAFGSLLFDGVWNTEKLQFFFFLIALFVLYQIMRLLVIDIISIYSAKLREVMLRETLLIAFVSIFSILLVRVIGGFIGNNMDKFLLDRIIPVVFVALAYVLIKTLREDLVRLSQKDEENAAFFKTLRRIFKTLLVLIKNDEDKDQQRR